MSGNGIEFARKVGYVGGAIIVVGTIVSVICAFAVSITVKPLVQQAADERSKIVQALHEETAARIAWEREYSQSRIDLVDVMMEPAGPRRDGKLARIRQEWGRP